MTNTQALIISVGIAVAGIGFAWAQPAPALIPGCVYNSTPPTLTNLQTSPLQCDVNGKLKVTTS